jgi:2-iminobutanoate/2-iminopropanoate deaminase
MEAIRCNELYSENAVFSQGIVADEFTFFSADARQADGSVEHGSPAAECARTLDCVRIGLNSCGQDLRKLVNLTVFLSDYAATAADVAAILGSHFDCNTTPAITMIGVSRLEGGCRVRMDALATTGRQQIKRVSIPDLPLAAGARCHAVRAHDFVFLSGVDAADNNGQVSSRTIESQTVAVLTRIASILKSEGLSLRNLCRTFMFMPSTEYRPGYGKARKEVYQSIFSDDEFPPNSGIYVHDLGRDVLLRSVAMAYVGRQTIIASPKVRKAPGSFSQSVRVGNWLLQAGQDAVGFKRVVEAEGDLAGQTRVTLQHIKDIVEEAGGSLDDIVKTTVYLTAGQERSKFTTAYQEFFAANKSNATLPAGLTVEVRELSPRCLVEIDAVALLRTQR